MDFIWNTAIRVVIYVLIYTIVKAVISKISLGGKIIKDDGNEIVIKKRGLSIFFLIIAIFFTILFSWVGTMPSNIDGMVKMVLTVAGVLFCMFWYLVSVMYGAWMIILKQEEIWYTNYVGKTKKIMYSEIVQYERQNNGDIFFKNSRNEILKVDVAHADEILLWISDRVKLDKKTDTVTEYIVRPAKYHRVLGVVSLTIFLLFLLLGIFVCNFWVITVFAIFVIVGIYNCLIQFNEQYIVSKNSIVYKNFKRKTIELFLNEVSKVVFENKDNVSYMLFYKNGVDRPVFKINTYYENAQKIKGLACNKKWIQ